ncbi:helix-turn-helix domain-containing protein [Fundidesulfovibrio putealis]|uniref:helix-turn-helix domain-containing protein n=1 Tax=Fundidesulfovibrio putealis TaxID=270496 RepID=UPI0004850827|nr:helix-turn-helix transcriptional regulator [Fundidesulfovibrio putealis]
MIVGRLREIMEEQGVTIQGLATDANLAERTIKRLRGNEFRQCRMETLEAIASALDVRVKDLFEEV